MAYNLPWLLNVTPSTIARVQQSPTITQVYSTSAWSPTTTSLSGVAPGNLLVSIGGWWDSNHGNGGTQVLPTDSNGSFSAARNPTLPDGVAPPGWPVHGQIGYIASANSGSHTFTPQNIGASGDGYFLVAEFGGQGSTWSLVDSGDNMAGSATAGAIDGVSVNTVGSSAQVGDLVIAVVVTDGDPTAIGVGAPTGYANQLLSSSTTTTNIAAGAGWKIVTTGGQQSASWTWADNDCKIGCGLIAVFRRN